jgi:hypothetical protein
MTDPVGGMVLVVVRSALLDRLRSVLLVRLTQAIYDEAHGQTPPLILRIIEGLLDILGADGGGGGGGAAPGATKYDGGSCVCGSEPGLRGKFPIVNGNRKRSVEIGFHENHHRVGTV